MTGEKYNGYSNYETWAVALWLANDEGSYRYWKEAAEGARRMGPISWGHRGGRWETSTEPREYLAEKLRDELTDGIPDLPPSLYADLITAALSEVDWVEVAEDFLSE